MIDLPKRGLPKGKMKGHGEAARPTWDDSKEWVGKRVVGTEGLAKGHTEEQWARLRESWLTRTRGGRETEDQQGRGRCKRRRKREMYGWKRRLEEGANVERGKQRETGRAQI